MTTVNNKHLFSSDDDLFQLVINGDEVGKVLSLCRESRNLETGGILIGYYSKKCKQAVVTKATESPSDSIQRKNEFIRGIKGLKRILDRFWQKKRYYLGEWHFHPNHNPNPSPRDIKQMYKLSEFVKLHCPEPILLTVGEDPDGVLKLKAHVFPRGCPYIELKSVNPDCIKIINDNE